MKSNYFVGELLGTFILVFIGTGSVAISILYEIFNLYEIAGIWSLAVAIAIYASKNFSNAHLNPAVSLAFLSKQQLSKHEFFIHITGQVLGAFLASAVLYFLLSHEISFFENSHAIFRGKANAKLTAMMFGEFYPNPTNKNLLHLPTLTAMILEGLGTFLLVLVIFLLVFSKSIKPIFHPILIGLTVGILIVFIAPYTQAGLNPARDFSPRLFSFMMGWRKAAFNLPNFGALLVYIIGPFLGAWLAAITHSFWLKMKMINVHKN
ncbi:MAG: MIP/aquaporin family protein [Putridiphycobacter sp.]